MKKTISTHNVFAPLTAAVILATSVGFSPTDGYSPHIINEQAISASAATAPAQAEFTSYSSSASAVKVNWKAVSGASGYRLYRYIDGNWKKVVTLSSKNTSYKETGLSPAVRYRYKVKAYKKVDGATVWGTASPLIETVTKPASFKMKSISATENSITIEWQPQECEGYKVYQYNGSAYDLIATIRDKSIGRCVIEDVQPGTTYKFKIRAFVKDANKNVKYNTCGQASVTTPVSIAKAKFTNSSSTASSVTLNWEKVSNASGYRVYRYDPSTKKWVNIKTLSGVNTLTYTDSAVDPNTQYRYKVKAYAKVNGNTQWGVASDLVAITTKDFSIAKAKFTSSSSTDSSVTLNWGKVSNASGYRVYRYDPSTKKWVNIKTLSGASTLTYTDSAVDPKTKYQYKVKAYAKINGNTLWGVASDLVEVTTKECTVSTPKFTSHTAASDSITLKWSKISGVTGYRIYDVTNGTKTVTTISNANTTSYTVKNLSSAKTYKFKIKAYKKINGNTYWGEASSAYSAKTADKTEPVTGIEAKMTRTERAYYHFMKYLHSDTIKFTDEDWDIMCEDLENYVEENLSFFPAGTTKCPKASVGGLKEFPEPTEANTFVYIDPACRSTNPSPIMDHSQVTWIGVGAFYQDLNLQVPGIAPETSVEDVREFQNQCYDEIMHSIVMVVSPSLYGDANVHLTPDDLSLLGINFGYAIQGNEDMLGASPLFITIYQPNRPGNITAAEREKYCPLTDESIDTIDINDPNISDFLVQLRTLRDFYKEHKSELSAQSRKAIEAALERRLYEGSF